MSEGNENKPNPQEMQVQLPPEVQRGVYANQMLASHTQEEFILDFILTTAPSAVVNARVVISPSHAKRMVAALQENIQKYETRFGEIAPVMPQLPDHVVRH
ncbi:MAG: DUF3467 domain-containing protein [Zetaproteobacteria bacterium]|nr:DUF3467 domain-containing protein [Zetaproteobacteria bacterium]